MKFEVIFILGYLTCVLGQCWKKSYDRGIGSMKFSFSMIIFKINFSNKFK